jgi:TRAP-type C4-dicarboxylate transport system substrate-binding protein
MNFKLTRRHFIAASLASASMPLPSFAQEKPVLKFSAVFSEQDIRAEMTKMFAKEIEGSFKLEPYYGGNLFKQGTELVALQRGNLQMGNIAPQDYAKQIPEWSVLSSAYLFRDAAHVRTFFDSPLGSEFKKMVEDQLSVRILGPTYFGARQVGLKPDKEIKTPADMAGIKLRMPGGDAWQFLGTALGANPVAMAYAEVYTGLQTGAIDGQDNPLPNVKNMKFYEVMSQIVLTSHLVGYDLLTVSTKVWNDMSPEQQAAFQAAADKVINWSQEQHIKQEGTLIEEFKAAGLKVYEPDVAAFRKFAREKYAGSELSQSWPQGIIEKVAAL